MRYLKMEKNKPSENFILIIQARSGSTRLPDKMNLPFYKDLTIPDVVISRLLERFSPDEIVLATTTNAKDDDIANTGKKYGISIFRGDEENVLERFIAAAKQFNVKNIVRVCADNPFIINGYIDILLKKFRESPCDYCSFVSSNGIPSIRTHLGFFTELTTLDALQRINSLTSHKLYREHVTNYIYDHANSFKIEFEQIPAFVESADVRLTVDTAEDFNNCKKVYSYLMENNLQITPENIISFVISDKELNESMKQQINLNRK